MLSFAIKIREIIKTKIKNFKSNINKILSIFFRRRAQMMPTSRRHRRHRRKKTYVQTP